MCRVLFTAMLSGCSTTAGEGQARIDERVEVRLRAEVGAGETDSIYVTRDYNRTYFPGATFYRTSFLRSGQWDIPSDRGAAVAVSDSIIPVRSLADLTLVWQATVVETSLRPFEVGLACSDLLVLTGHLSAGARFIEAAEEIPTSRRKLLRPQSALDRPLRSNERSSAEGNVASFSVLDRDLLRVTCTVNGRTLRVSVDTVAKTPHNEP